MSNTKPPSTLDSGIFRAYDIRGITTQNLTEEVAYWIGRSFATAALAEGQNIAVVGLERRPSRPTTAMFWPSAKAAVAKLRPIQ